MSKAREIAEERLAKGEISEEEFERITNKLGSTTPETHAPQELSTASAVPEEAFISKQGWFLWMLPVLILLPIRLGQESIENMGSDWQFITIAALGLGAVGGVKWLFGK